jgi:hypothetical protein
MPGRPAFIYRGPAKHPSSKALPHAGLADSYCYYLPEPGKAQKPECLQFVRQAALKVAKGVGNSFQTVTNQIPPCQRGTDSILVTKARI